MQFGIFVPQGWRLDLAGIPVERHWPVMRELAQYADRPNSGYSSIWVYEENHSQAMRPRI
jgi:hypothetical protein